MRHVPGSPRDYMPGACFKGGGDDTRTVTSTQTSQPPAYLQPYLTDIAQQAQNQFQSGSPSYFPGATYVPMSGQTQGALQGIENRAMSGSPLAQAGQDTMLSTARGDFLNANPHLQGAIDTATRPLQENFMNQTLPALNSMFSGAGRYGSNAQVGQGGVIDTALGNLNRSMGDVASNMAFNNYGMERGMQNQAALAAPEYAMNDFNDLGQLLSAGQMREGYQGSQLQDAIDRHNFEQNLPAAKLGQYAGTIYGGNTGGTVTGTQTSPVYGGGSWQGPFGAALGTAGVAGNLLGKGGANILGK